MPDRRNPGILGTPQTMAGHRYRRTRCQANQELATYWPGRLQISGRTSLSLFISVDQREEERKDRRMMKVDHEMASIVLAS